MHLSEVDLESSRGRWKQSNSLTPEHLGDKHLFALPANSAIVTYWADDVALIVPDLVKQNPGKLGCLFGKAACRARFSRAECQVASTSRKAC